MKKYERQALIVILVTGVALFVFGLWSLLSGLGQPGKLFASAGLVAALAGVVQLEVSGFFGKLLEKFLDEDDYPYGPPSYITREIIDNPDQPLRMKMRNHLFFDLRTGFWLIVIGTILQLIGTWL